MNWTKSSYCAAATCTEVAVDDGGDVLIRDSKNPDQEPLRLSQAQWAAFAHSIRGTLPEDLER